MKEKAFTLIEVMVVMAIISVLAGMLIPNVWKFWESEEISVTRQRMRDLKYAMIGDRSLVQNGVRTHYGFVGDFGTLPFVNKTSCALSYLNSSNGMTAPVFDPANWSGRYLPSSSDYVNYASDAWGRQIECTNKIIVEDRLIGLTLKSVSPGGDIIEELIEPNDVISSNRIAGNVFGSFSAGALLKIQVTPDKTGAFDTMSISNKQLNGFSSYTALLPHKLPIGRVNIEVEIRNHPLTDPVFKNRFQYFSQDNQQVIRIPDLHIP